jgi:hypothetical protein
MRLAAAAVVLALAAIDCSNGSERALLDQFFTASRLRDRTALARFSTVVFEPPSDGIVEKFVVAAVTPERQLVSDDASDDAIRLEGEGQRVVGLSLADPIDPVDPGRSRITLWEKTVTVSAQVRSADGTTAARSIVVTLQCARVADDRARSGRWIVVRFVG